MRKILFLILLAALASVFSLAEEKAAFPQFTKIVGEEAFYGDQMLEKIVFDKNVEVIEEKAFADCTGLKEVYCFSDNVQIAENAFDGVREIVVYCHRGSTMEEFAQKMGFEVKRPILFDIKCDTYSNGAVGLPITWEAVWQVSPPEGEISYTWTVVRKSGGETVASFETDNRVFSYTPDQAENYAVRLTILEKDLGSSCSRESEAVEVADAVYFGTYEQDGKASTKDRLEWTVLDVQNGEALLITKKIIRNDSYFNPEWIKYKYTYWAESCVGSTSSINWWGVIAKDSMKITDITPEHVPLEDHTFGKEEDIFYVHSRYWLNEIFYESAFSAEEKSRIITVHNVNEDNPEHGTDSGPDSDDNVFFLSYSELIRYMPTAASRKASMTSMAVRESDENIGKYWWLRTSGAERWFAMHVQGSNGHISYFGSDVGHDNVGYRPCIRITVGG